MSEPTGENTSGGDGGGNWTPPANQEEFNRIIGERIARERSKYADYADLKTKAERLAELESAGKSEIEKANERAQAAETAAQAHAAELAKAKAALKYKLSDEDLDLLGSGTAEEIDARAKRLSERLAPKPPEYDGGARTTASGGKDMNSVIRKAAGLA
jgi:hypothetical protein